MRLSMFYAKTLREDPQEAETISHRLMIRAGLVKKVSTGIYAYLPLGLKVLHRIMSIVRSELDEIGCSELLLPALIPAEPWKKTGRWDLYGKEMFRLQDRTDRFFCLGPTHEEVVTEVVKNDIKSYRDLPLFVYQIQTKYRDELRPRYGVVRAKEFIMKDLYSYHADEASLEEGYQKVFEAYRRILDRCSISFTPIEADNGTIGGAYSHEFVAKTLIGETEYAICTKCAYAANLEAAKSKDSPSAEADKDSLEAMEEVATPGKKAIGEVAEFLGEAPSAFLKTLCYRNSKGKKILAVLLGDDELSEAKFKKIAGADIEWSHEDQELMGYIGPVGMSGVLIIADEKAVNVHHAICGANKVDTHLKNVTYGRDWKAQISGDIRVVKSNDLCPLCGSPLQVELGMELGHTFVLNDRYTKPLGVQFTTIDGKAKTALMGCYGIGISRMMAAIVEQHHDEKGIQWPITMAPFQVIVIPVNVDQLETSLAAEKICKELNQSGITSIWDDRPLSPGVKFKDAELIGFPFMVVAGRDLANACVELKLRHSNETRVISLNDIVAEIQRIVTGE